MLQPPEPRAAGHRLGHRQQEGTSAQTADPGPAWLILALAQPPLIRLVLVWTQRLSLRGMLPVRWRRAGNSVRRAAQSGEWPIGVRARLQRRVRLQQQQLPVPQLQVLMRKLRLACCLPES